MNKIVRTVCLFSDKPTESVSEKLNTIVEKLESNGYMVQTKRVASRLEQVENLLDLSRNGIDYISVGSINLDQAKQLLPTFYDNKSLSFNMELANDEVTLEHIELLNQIIGTKASKTFSFTYTFNNAPSSPYFPSAVYEKNGFAIGLQPTDLSEGCDTLEQWLGNMKQVWDEISSLFADEPDFLGIDSSIAPLFEGSSSFVNFVKRLGYSFSQTVTTDMYTTITKFIKEQNPKPVGLCGMMLPCTEDFELTAEYEAGNFSIERNVYLSLHSGLGIDTYPIGVDERPERVVEILKLIQSLSNKYNKPLSARFVSDGKAKIGEQSDFQDQYLKDCVIRAL
ncbi:DUF711 family protein [Candidatus Saccharibacteria bacterium]|nr:DUF711 family protein [Candidatus Saccharibacteria bacterium]